jgi:predicted ArsR family transcriptional regulator
VTNPWDQRFFASTRGRLVSLLRGQGRTVDELAKAVDLTDNAVRAHLATLERDGLVHQEGIRRGGGSGKPAYAYGLTAEAEALFPKAYGEVLRQLLQVLSQKLDPAELEATLSELARRLAEGHHASGPPEERLATAVSYLDEMGGMAEWRAEAAGYLISGRTCPLAGILPGNPKVCRLAELMLAEVTGLPVHEQCQKAEARCQFSVAASTN